MAKKGFIKDLNNIEMLPITRGELVLDSSGKLALHSNEFLATDSLPGLMSKEDKAKLDNLTENGYTIDLVSATTDGLAPKIGTAAASTVTTQADEWVLTSTKGATPTWRKLPTNAFLNYYRPILVNGTSLLGNNNTALNIVAGNNINLTTDAGKVTINNGLTKLSQLTNDSGYLTSNNLNNYVTLDTDLTITGLKTFQLHMNTKFILGESGRSSVKISTDIVGGWARGLTVQGVQGDGVVTATFGVKGDTKDSNGNNKIDYLYLAHLGQDYGTATFKVLADRATILNNTVLHAGNYNNYAPKLDGTGAIGDWNINITGNAATADKLKTKVQLWGNDFDGSNAINSSMWFINNSHIYMKDTSNNYSSVLVYNSANTLALGYGSCGRGHSTDIYGSFISFLTGTNRTLAMIITSAGNVGIGTTAPSSKLDILGTLKCNQFFDIRDLDNAKNRLTFQIASGVGRLYTYSDDDATFKTLYLGRNDTKAIVVTGDGKVGIGTSNPGALLSVNGSIAVGNDSVGNILMLRPSHNYIWATNKGGTIILGVKDDGDTGPQNASLLIKSNTVCPGSRDNTVDLGTPTYRWKSVYSYSGNFKGTLKINDITALNRDANNRLHINYANNDLLDTFIYGNNVRLHYGTPSNYNTGLILLNSGNVGIGTVTPTQKLEVSGNVKATSFIGNLDWSYITNKPTSFTPAAHDHTRIINTDTSGRGIEGTLLPSKFEKGLTFNTIYGGIEKSWPVNYGNVVTIRGNGDNLIVISWNASQTETNTNVALEMYIRSKRDSAAGDKWSDWTRVITDRNYPEYCASKSHTHASSQITALTGYAKATSASDLVTTDTLNTALGKLEYKAGIAYSWYRTITEDDTDAIINKWDEVVDFVNNLEVDLTEEFVTRKTDLTITGIKTFKNNRETIVLRGSDIITDVNTYGGWARGTYFNNTSGDTTVSAVFGVFGLGIGSDGSKTNSINYLYLAHQNLDWITATFKVYGNKATISGNEIYHKGNLKNLSDLNDDVVSGKYLRLTGGIIKNGTSDTPLILNTSRTEGDIGMRFSLNDVSKGWIGYNNSYGTYLYTYTGPHRLGIKDNGVAYCDSYTLLHSGNSNIKNGVITINGTSITPLTSHQSLANYVTLNTALTISGVKTFNTSLQINSGSSITDEGGNGVLGVKSKTWTGVPSDGTAISLGTLGNSLYFRSNGNNLYHYRNDKQASYLLLDAYNYTSYVNTTNFPGLAGVRSVTINGDYLRVNTNGTNKDLTIPYATQATKLKIIALTLNLDLNITTEGVYGTSASNIISSLSNKPSNMLGGECRLEVLHCNSSNYFLLLLYALGNNAYKVWHRFYRSGTWSKWIELLNSSNYNSFSPKLDGTGATGTWSINITGSAGSIAWGNITGKPTIPTVTDYYWANVKISSTSSTTTTPTFGEINTPSIKATTDTLALISKSGYIYLRYNGNDTKSVCLTDYAFIPTTMSHEKLNLGGPSNRWADFYSINGDFKGKVLLGRVTRDFTNYPEATTYKMGLTNVGDIHFKGASEDKGNSITWSWGYDTLVDAGIYVKHHGNYGSKMYLATASSWSTGPIAAIEIEHNGSVNILRNNLKVISGNIHISHIASADMSTSSSNPQIVFSENGSLPVQLMYTDWDDYRSPAGLKVLGSQGNEWFEVAGKTYSAGFVKNSSSDSYVLLGGGGHKAISNFLLKSEIANQELSANLTTITKSLTVTADWMDTGIKYTDLATGTYIVQLTTSGTNIGENTNLWSTIWSGVMSWRGSGTNDDDSDEIILHRSGHAYGNTLYLRTIMTTGTDGRHLRLLIAANKNLGAAYTYTFKFKRII